jgi:hypothetical protein
VLSRAAGFGSDDPPLNTSRMSVAHRVRTMTNRPDSRVDGGRIGTYYLGKQIV